MVQPKNTTRYMFCGDQRWEVFLYLFMSVTMSYVVINNYYILLANFL